VLICASALPVGRRSGLPLVASQQVVGTELSRGRDNHRESLFLRGEGHLGELEPESDVPP
jgi:hypothetical protein